MINFILGMALGMGVVSQWYVTPGVSNLKTYTSEDLQLWADDVVASNAGYQEAAKTGYQEAAKMSEGPDTDLDVYEYCGLMSEDARRDVSNEFADACALILHGGEY